MNEYFLIYSSQVFFICYPAYQAFYCVGGYPHLITTSYSTLMIGKSPPGAFTLLHWG